MSKKTIIGNTADNFEVSNKSVRRLALDVVATTTATPSSSNFIDLSQIQIVMEIQQAGRREVMFSGPLSFLGRFCSYFNGGFSSWATPYNAYQTVATNKQLVSLCIDLGHTINLLGNDKITVRINQQNGWCGSAVTAASTYINYEWRDSIGIQEYIPVFDIKLGITNAGQDTFSPGDNVIQYGYVSSLVTGPTDANSQFTYITLNSNNYKQDDTLYTLINRRQQQFESYAEAPLRYHTFIFTPVEDLDGLEIKATFNSSNITANSFAFMACRMVSSGQILTRAHNLRRSKLDYNEKKLSQIA